MRVLLAFLLAAQPAFAGPIAHVPLSRLRGGTPVPFLRSSPTADAKAVPTLGASLGLKTPDFRPGPIPGPVASLEFRLADVGGQVLADRNALSSLSGESSRSVGALHLALLQGEKTTPRPVLGSWEPGPSKHLDPRKTWRGFRRAFSKPPAVEDPQKRRAVAYMRLGTAAFKAGMEVVRVGVPLLVGGATGVALLVVTYGVSQAGFASVTGALTDRFPAHKVLAGALAVQAGLVAAALLLGVAGALTPWALFPIYALIGATVGVIDTTRKTIPSLILGQDAAALNRYNGSLHVYYETAGVAGALVAGVLIGALGPLNAMIIQPPFYALAAFLFWKVRHPFTKAEAKPREGRRIGAGARAYFADIKEGFRTLAREKALAWMGAAMVLPQLVHRVFEDLMLPVYAKGILGSGTDSAWLTASSNLGELVGALLLLKLAERFKGPAAWVRWAALGLLLAWAMTMTTSLAVLLPVILVFSMTWASSDLSLLSGFQARLPEKSLPRVLSVLAGTAALLGAAGTLLLGRFMDAVPLADAVAWIVGGFTAVAAVVWLASRKLKK